MPHSIVILSPGKNCRKTNKIIQALKAEINKNHWQAKIEIITRTEQFLNYKTWILPTIIIDNKIVSRGYFPSKKKLQKFLK